MPSTELAGKAENLEDNVNEQTGAAPRNHDVVKSKKQDIGMHLEPPAIQKKRLTARSLKTVSKSSENKSSNFVPTRKSSPAPYISSRQSRSPDKESVNLRLSRKKSPMKKTNTQFSLNHCPKTVVGDLNDDSQIEDQYGLRQQISEQFNVPADLELLSCNDMTYKMQNLEVENAMLKNELNVMNREVTELLDRLRKTEDDLCKTHAKLEKSEVQNQELNLELKSQNFQLQQLKNEIVKITGNEFTNSEILKHKETNDLMETQIKILRGGNEELEDKLKQLTAKINEHNTTQTKLETELRHAQCTISTLQVNLKKSTAKCQRLGKDWEAYKLRVKDMLCAKNKKIKELHKCVTVAESTKTLTEQLEKFKEQRERLSEAVSCVRSDCAEMKQNIEGLESRHHAAEQVVTALRNALRDEHAANNRAEVQYVALGKELKELQIETEETIETLRSALRDTDCELHNIRNSVSSIRTVDTSALNVADYDVTHASVDSEREGCLTEALVQNQGRIDSLLADNNMLRIRLEKLECKYKAEMLSMCSNHNKMIHQQDDRRQHAPVASLSDFSIRVGVMMKWYPAFRMFTVVYMKDIENISKQIKDLRAAATEDVLSDRVSYHDLHHYVAIYIIGGAGVAALVFVVARRLRRRAGRPQPNGAGGGATPAPPPASQLQVAYHAEPSQAMVQCISESDVNLCSASVNKGNQSEKSVNKSVKLSARVFNKASSPILQRQLA